MRAIGKFDSPHKIAFEELPNFRQIIQREDKLSADFPETLLKLDEISLAEVETVELAIPIRWIEVEKSLWSVVPLENFFIGQALNLDLFKTLMNIFKELRKASRIEIWRPSDAVVVVALQN